jgi:hypothetical protein
MVLPWHLAVNCNQTVPTWRLRKEARRLSASRVIQMFRLGLKATTKIYFDFRRRGVFFDGLGAA